VHIFRYLTMDKILDSEDWMCLEPRNKELWVTLPESRFYKIATCILHHYLDFDSWKVVRWDMLPGPSEKWADYKSTPGLEGEPQARILSLVRDDAYRNPDLLRLTRRKGKVIGAGAVRMVGKPTESLTLLLPEFEIKRLALACLDYIRAWELTGGYDDWTRRMFLEQYGELRDDDPKLTFKEISKHAQRTMTQRTEARVEGFTLRIWQPGDKDDDPDPEPKDL